MSMSKVNNYIWDGSNNDVIKVTQLSLDFIFITPEPNIDSSYMESFGIPLRDGTWLEMSHWAYGKPTNWFNELEAEDRIFDMNSLFDGYDISEDVEDENDLLKIMQEEQL